MPGTLVLVPNTLDFRLDTVDLRAVLPDAVIERAATLDHWVVENARTTRAFLKRVEAIRPLARPLQQLHIVELPRPDKGRPNPAAPGAVTRNSPTARAAAVSDDPWAALLQPARDGHDIGLQCEAGLPAIADPGAPLVRAAHAAGIAVLPMSGPSSLLLALGASGLDGQSFAFVGYLPVQPDERAGRIRQLEAQSRTASQTQLVIETPYRNAALLAALLAGLSGATRLSVACGLTTPGGWVRTDRVADWRQQPARQVVPGDVPAVFSFLAVR